MDGQWSDWERRVLQTFIDAERITQLPAKQKKRKVILKWLACRIPRDLKMSHRDFNHLLQAYHPDSATLRRELFEYGYVHRDRDFYWIDESPRHLDV